MRRLRVKLTSVWPDAEASLTAFIRPDGLASQTCDFFLNDADCRSADVWIVLDQVVTEHDVECEVFPGCFVNAMNETARPKEYFLHYPERMEFLRQFDAVYSFHDLPLANLIHCPPFLPWMIDSNHGSVLRTQPVGVAQLASTPPSDKTKTLSIITSDKVITPAQRRRLEFAELVSKTLGADVEWFGSGINPVDTKREALDPFRFHLAMENRIQRHIISEKLYDAFLGWSLPIYWGAPNVGDFFPQDSVLAVNVLNPNVAIQAIYNAIEGDLHEYRSEALRNARQVVLGRMNWTERLARVACDVFARRLESRRVSHQLTIPKIPSHIGYRELNADT